MTSKYITMQLLHTIIAIVYTELFKQFAFFICVYMCSAYVHVCTYVFFMYNFSASCVHSCVISYYFGWYLLGMRGDCHCWGGSVCMHCASHFMVNVKDSLLRYIRIYLAMYVCMFCVCNMYVCMLCVCTYVCMGMCLCLLRADDKS